MCLSNSWQNYRSSPPWHFYNKIITLFFKCVITNSLQNYSSSPPLHFWDKIITSFIKCVITNSWQNCTSYPGWHFYDKIITLLLKCIIIYSWLNSVTFSWQNYNFVTQMFLLKCHDNVTKMSPQCVPFFWFVIVYNSLFSSDRIKSKFNASGHAPNGLKAHQHQYFDHVQW